MIMLLQIFSWFWEWKNFENRLIFDKVKVSTQTVRFLAHPVYCSQAYIVISKLMLIRPLYARQKQTKWVFVICLPLDTLHTVYMTYNYHKLQYSQVWDKHNLIKLAKQQFINKNHRVSWINQVKVTPSKSLHNKFWLNSVYDKNLTLHLFSA